MHYPIVPPSYAKGIPRITKAGLFMIIFPILFVLLWCLHMISLTYCVIFSSIFAIIIFYMLAISLPYHRIAVSQVVFFDNRLEIQDSHGKAWRIIAYNHITDIKVVEIDGFMHGYHGVSGIATYIVIFENGCKLVPVNRFIDKYRDSNYFPIYYQREVWDNLQTYTRNGKYDS